MATVTVAFGYVYSNKSVVHAFIEINDGNWMYPDWTVRARDLSNAHYTLLDVVSPPLRNVRAKQRRFFFFLYKSPCPAYYWRINPNKSTGRKLRSL